MISIIDVFLLFLSTSLSRMFGARFGIVDARDENDKFIIRQVSSVSAPAVPAGMWPRKRKQQLTDVVPTRS